MNDQDMHRVLDQLFQANPTFSFLFECSSPLDGGLHSSRVMLGVQEAHHQEEEVLNQLFQANPTFPLV